MKRLNYTVAGAALLIAAAGGLAVAQEVPAFDPAQLPEVKGKVVQYTLNPRGGVDGLILGDGTEVHLPPHLSTQLVFVARPGDAVTVHGLKARSVPMVAAASVTNDATGATVVDPGPGGGGPRGPRGTRMEQTGQVKAQLHSPRGETDGVLLDDGTQVRLPPPEAEKLAAQLAVGQTLYVAGDGTANVLGKLIVAREIGPSKAQAIAVAGPPDRGGPWGRWMHDRMGMRGPGPHGPGPHGPAGGPGPDDDGPDGDGPPPPPPPAR